MDTQEYSKHHNLSYAFKLEKELWDKSNVKLVDLCRKLHYPDLNCRIMQLDENVSPKEQQTAIKKDKEILALYLKFSKDRRANKRKGENRSWTEYFKQLIAGWIEEDLLILLLRANGIQAKRNDVDGQRIIDIGNAVDQTPDIIVKIGENERRIELTNEYNDILKNNGYIEKRCPSIVKMWQEGSIWLFRDRANKKYVLVDFANERVIIHLRHHNNGDKNWSKDVNRYVLSENKKVIRDDEKLISELVSVISSGIKGDVKPDLEEIEDQDSPPKEFAKGGKRKSETLKQPISIKEEKTQEITNPRAKQEVAIAKLETSRTKQQSKDIAQKSPLQQGSIKTLPQPPKEATEENEPILETISEDIGESDIDGDWDNFQVDDGGFV